MKPKLLDLFCGAGGAGMGYHRAGFDVVGVDWKPQKRYPFEFVQGDAIAYALAHGWQFDAIHASPPCQAHSHVTPDKSKHVDLIPQTRFALETLGLPYIIENVMGAKKALHNPVMLCGADFGLKVYRHRLFESNILLLVPSHVPHRDNTPSAGHGVSSAGFLSITSGGHGITPEMAKTLEHLQDWVAYKRAEVGTSYNYVSQKGFMTVTSSSQSAAYARFAMGIEWMTNDELAQAIPPAYTEYLGRQLMRHVVGKAQACVIDGSLLLEAASVDAAQMPAYILIGCVE